MSKSTRSATPYWKRLNINWRSRLPSIHCVFLGTKRKLAMIYSTCPSLKLRRQTQRLVFNAPHGRIGHFRIPFGLVFKACPSYYLFIWKLVCICMWMKTNFQTKGWAPGLAFKKRPMVIRKWLIPQRQRPRPTPKVLLKLAFITIFEDREIIYKSKTLLDEL